MTHLWSAISGRYEATGNPAERDCIEVHSWGNGDKNWELAEFALTYADDKTLIMADQGVSTQLRALGAIKVEEMAGDIGEHTIDPRPGTWGALNDMYTRMAAENLHNPLLVGSAHHIGRIVLQSTKMDQIRKLEVNHIVPSGLPIGFDRTSVQRHVHGPIIWGVHETAVAMILRFQGRI